MISGKWRLDALIGVGGMAAVYMATHRNGAVGAIKILHEEVGMNQEVRERFLREAYIANKVGHDGTVKVLDDDEDENGVPFIVMELLQGRSVEDAAEDAGGTLSVEATLDVIDQTLAVLEAAHEHKIIHRDLKPENLFQLPDGRIKVLDFGIARLREDNAKKTQTGMVMGTPSFMAPEQAMGRWTDVDARTDLYAVGATAFTLLSGHPVHEAETAGEMLVAAATRPARSLARVLHNAPFNLVALVDRALSYERDNRFSSAIEFREEIVRVRESLSGDEAVQADARPEAAILPATMLGADSPEDYERAERDAQFESFDPSTNSPEEIERMAEVFKLMERGLVARKQYGEDHPETKRRFKETFKELASALMTCDICLAWNFTPYAFVAGDSVVWEPEVPWNRIPYQLFSDGVRTMGLVPGMDEDEFYAWLDVITLDPTMDLAPEDDLVTTLWDANFDYVFHQAIDSFAEGNQEQRLRYESDRQAVIDSAHQDTARETATAWKEGRRDRSMRHGAGGKTKQVMDFINSGSPMDAEAAARVANLRMEDLADDEAKTSDALDLDPGTRALLAARLAVDVGGASTRFVVAAAEAFVASARMGRSETVSAPLRRAVDGLSAGEPTKAMDMVVELREAVQIDGKELETDNLRNTLTSEVLSPKTLLSILQGSTELDENTVDLYLKGLERILQCVQQQHLDAAIEFLPISQKGKVRDMVFAFLLRASKGHEQKLGKLFIAVDMELGLELVRLLVELDNDAAKEAISMATDSPHPLVRIEALGHIEGVGGTRVRNELRRLLDDEQGGVRLAALRAMEQHRISAAGPFLVVRMKEKSFLKLSYEERRQALSTVTTLRPARAAELCIMWLEDDKLFRSSNLENMRELAAEFLGECGHDDKARGVLTAVAGARPWKASKDLKAAAAAGLERFEARAKERASRRQEGKGEEPKRKRPRSKVRRKEGTEGGTQVGKRKKRTEVRKRRSPSETSEGSDGRDQRTATGK